MVAKTHRPKYCNLHFPKLDKMAREIITKMGRNKRRIVPDKSRTILESRKANIKRDYNRLISSDGKYVRRRPYYTGRKNIQIRYFNWLHILKMWIFIFLVQCTQHIFITPILPQVSQLLSQCVVFVVLISYNIRSPCTSSLGLTSPQINDKNYHSIA